MFELRQVSAGAQLVEDVVVPLTVRLNETSPSVPRSGQPAPSQRVSDYLKNHPGLLQEIRPHVGSGDAVPPVKADLRVLPKAAAVVVPGGLCVPDRLDRNSASGWEF